MLSKIKSSKEVISGSIPISVYFHEMMWSHLASDSNDFNTNHTSIATQLEIHRIFPSKNHQLFVLSSHVQLSKLFWAIRRGWGWNQTRLLKTRWWIMWIMSIHKWWWYKYTSGWWLKNNLEKYEFVNGKDDIPHMKWEKTCSKPIYIAGFWL